MMTAFDPPVEGPAMPDAWDTLTVVAGPCPSSSFDTEHAWDDWEEPTRLPLAHFPASGGPDYAVRAWFGRCRNCQQALLGLGGIRAREPEWTAAIGGAEIR